MILFLILLSLAKQCGSMFNSSCLDSLASLLTQNSPCPTSASSLFGSTDYSPASSNYSGSSGGYYPGYMNSQPGQSNCLSNPNGPGFGGQQGYQGVPTAMPSMYNSQPSNVSPAYTTPPNGQSFANPCDNSMERNKYKECVKNALNSLKSILANCKKALGNSAPECTIDKECLDSLNKISDGRDDCKSDKFKGFLDCFLKELKNLKQSRHRGGHHRHKRRKNCRSGKSDSCSSNDPC